MQAVLRWLHYIGVAFWAGGTFVNALVLEPSMLAISPPERGKLMGAFGKRFIPLVWGSVVVVGITGLILTNSLIGLSGLLSFDTRYGNILLTKTIVVALMILNGVYLSALGPKIASFAPPPGGPPPAGPGEGARPPGPPPELLRLQGRMATLSWVQVVLMLVVLFLIAL
ncbi:MAG: CopD family protein [Anaerolineae bacterium]